MSRLVWFVLNDGRSVVAGCDSMTRDMLDSALAEPERTLTLTSDDSVHRLPIRDVRKFVLFDSKMHVPPTASIYHFVQV
jgi:hypothetical protein